MPDPQPYTADQIGQLPSAGDVTIEANYYFRVVKALLKAGARAVVSSGAPEDAQLGTFWLDTSGLAEEPPTSVQLKVVSAIEDDVPEWLIIWPPIFGETEELRGVPIFDVAPEDGQVLAFIDGSWRPAEADLGGGGGGGIDAESLRGVEIADVAPANGQVLKVVGGIWTPAADAVGGGGGGGGGNIFGSFPIDTPPVAPHAMDDEFNGEALDPSWSWSIGYPTITTALEDGKLVVRGEGKGGSNVPAMLMKAIPDENFTIQAALTWYARKRNFFGLGLVAEAPNKRTTGVFDLHHTSYQPMNCLLWSRYSPYPNPGLETEAPATTNWPNALYWQLKRTGTVLEWAVSEDGYLMQPVYRFDFNGLMDGIAKVGFGFQTYVQEGQSADLIDRMTALIYWWRRVA